MSYFLNAQTFSPTYLLLLMLFRYSITITCNLAHALSCSAHTHTIKLKFFIVCMKQPSLRNYTVFQSDTNQVLLQQGTRFATVKWHNKLVCYILVHNYINCILKGRYNYSDINST